MKRMVVVNRDYRSITTLTLTGNYNNLGIGSDEIRCNALSVSMLLSDEAFHLQRYLGHSDNGRAIIQDLARFLERLDSAN